MKALVPERVVVTNPIKSSGGGVPDVWHHLDGTDYIFGLPIDSSIAQLDDYFVQASTRHDINDVVHGKMVGPSGGRNFVLPTKVTYGSKVGYLPTDVVYLNTSGKSASALGIRPVSKVIERQELVYPNYKGRKPVKPYVRTWHERVTRYVVVRTELFSSITTSGDRKPLKAPGCDIRVYWQTPTSIDRKGQVRLGSLWMDICQFGVPGNWEVLKASGRGRHVDWNVVGAGRLTTHPAKFSQHDSAVEAMAWLNALTSWDGLFDVLSIWDKESTTTSTTAKAYWASSVDVDSTTLPVPSIRSGFLLQEPEVFGEKVDPLLLGKDIKFRGYWRNYLTQHALLDALERFPKLNDNSISNIMEVVGFIKTLVTARQIEIPLSLREAWSKFHKGWGDDWLTYRYVYSTTKMDVKEAVRFVNRMTNLGDLSRGVTCYGISHHLIDGVDVTCRASINVRPRNVSILASLMRALDQYGLSPDFYVVWDMTPYSFMVDWFLPIADILSTLDADAKYFSGEWYDLSDLCYSFSYSREVEGKTCHFYTRWKGSIPSALNSYYWFESPSVGGKTVVKRVIDAAALFIGR